MSKAGHQKAYKVEIDLDIFEIIVNYYNSSYSR